MKDMFAKSVLSDEERIVDSQLGYPRGYAKLCRHAYIQMQGLITPYTEGPPQRFLPYAPLEEELNKLKEFDTLFPFVDEEERDPSNARRHADVLWQQLDHLGNAGFDPEKFRVDIYGNVLYRNADTGSPLAWEVDHWFPHSRGGKTVISNLRIVQWQVNQRKSKKLEFLVPWWDLQIGISVNQFLSVFSSKNADFRQRAFSLFFQGGENEQLDDKIVVDCHSWPQHFREKKHQVGIAPAAIVKVHKGYEDTLRVINNNRAVRETYQTVATPGNTPNPQRRRWTLEEEEALRRAVQKFGPGNWKDIKEYEPVLVNRSTVQIKDKYRLMKGEWNVDKENNDDPSDRRGVVSATLRREEKLKFSQEEDKKLKLEDLAKLEEDLKEMKIHNEKEKAVIEELEKALAKQRKRSEKQRKWSETQSQYRLCLEKMIRDTMHQCVVYKEQARLNQAACNALLARLESQKAACDAAEMDLVKRVKQRETLEAMARPNKTKGNRNEGQVDVGSCVKSNTDSRAHEGFDRKSAWPLLFGTQQKTNQKHVDDDDDDDVNSEQQCQDSNDPRKGTCSESLSEEEDCNEGSNYVDEEEGTGESDGPSVDTLSRLPESETRLSDEDDNQVRHNLTSNKYATHKKNLQCTNSNASAGVKRKPTEVHDIRNGYVEQNENDDTRSSSGEEESIGENAALEKVSPCNTAASSMPQEELCVEHEQQKTGFQYDDRNRCSQKSKDEEQLDELLQEVLEMKGKVESAMADAIEDDEDEMEKIKRMGKFNLDKWLHTLLLNPTVVDNEQNEMPHHPEELQNKSDKAVHDATLDAEEAKKRHVKPAEADVDDGGKGAGLIGGFLKRLNFNQKHPQEESQPEGKGVPTEVKTSTMKTERSKSSRNVDRRKVSPWRQGASPSFKRVASVNVAGTAGSFRWKSAEKLKKSAEKKQRESTEKKLLEKKLVESFKGLKLDNKKASDDEEDSEVAFQIACESEFVEKMRAAREREEKRRRRRKPGVARPLQELLVESSTGLSDLNEGSPTTTECIEPEPLKTRFQNDYLTTLNANNSNNGATSAMQQPEQQQQQQQKHKRSLSASRHVDMARRHRSVSTPPGDRGHARQAEPAQPFDVAEEAGAAARKADFLKSASMRPISNAAATTGVDGRNVQVEPPTPPNHRRVPSFMQDFDAAQDGFRASLTHVWKKAVKKFEMI